MADTATRSQDRHAQPALVVRLPDDLRTQIKDQAEKEERTLTQVVRRALRMYLEQQDAATA